MTHSKRSISASSRVLILPMLFLYVFFVGGGVLDVVKESLGYIPAIGLNKISIESYQTLVEEKDFWSDILYSLGISLIATLISTIIGIGLAYYLHQMKRTRGKGGLTYLLRLGLMMPYLYMTFLVVLMVSKSGFYSRLLFKIGLISSLDAFPQVIYNPYGIGIVLVYVCKGIPFVALFMANILEGFTDRYDEVARTLGAGHLTRLIRLYLPLCSTTIVWCSSLLFAYDMASFEVPYLLGTNAHTMIGSKLYSLYINPNIEVIPQTMAMTLIILGVCSLLVLIYGESLRLILKVGSKSRFSRKTHVNMPKLGRRR